jgi:hypothetical protein
MKKSILTFSSLIIFAALVGCLGQNKDRPQFIGHPKPSPTPNPDNKPKPELVSDYTRFFTEKLRTAILQSNTWLSQNFPEETECLALEELTNLDLWNFAGKEACRYDNGTLVEGTLSIRHKDRKELREVEGEFFYKLKGGSNFHERFYLTFGETSPEEERVADFCLLRSKNSLRNIESLKACITMSRGGRNLVSSVAEDLQLIFRESHIQGVEVEAGIVKNSGSKKELKVAGTTPWGLLYSESCGALLWDGKLYFRFYEGTKKTKNGEISLDEKGIHVPNLAKPAPWSSCPVEGESLASTLEKL